MRRRLKMQSNPIQNIHKCIYCHSWKVSWQNIAHESIRCGTHITFQVSNQRHASTIAKLLAVEQRSPPKSEEADTRVIRYLNHAAQIGYRKAYLRTVDTDVVVLAMDHFNQLGSTELWVGLGTWKHFREIPIHVISEQLGPRRCQSFLLFNAFTGCDVTSFMFGKTAWSAWLSYPHLTDTFIALLEDPKTLDLCPGHMEHQKRFTVLKTAIQAQSMKSGNYFSHKVWNPSTPSHQQCMHCFNIQSEPSSSQHLFGSNHLSRGQWFLFQVNGVGVEWEIQNMDALIDRSP